MADDMIAVKQMFNLPCFH